MMRMLVGWAACLASVVSSPVQAQVVGPSARPLNSDAWADSRQDDRPSLATDGLGTVVTAWIERGHYPYSTVMVAASANGGLAWTGPRVLDEYDAVAEYVPAVATDGLGTWIVAWESNDQGPPLGNDQDLLYRRSTDGGATWSSSAPLNSYAAVDTYGTEEQPRIATDGGAWIAVWGSNHKLAGSVIDWDIHYARSTDAGATWTAAALIDGAMSSDNTTDTSQNVATAGGTWIVTWATSTGKVKLVRSTNSGLNWSPPVVLPNWTTDSPGVAMAGDGSGHWVACWNQNNLIKFSRSPDDGVHWTAPATLSAAVSPSIATDGLGHWMVSWRTSGSSVQVVLSDDAGATWADPLVVGAGYGPQLIHTADGLWDVAWAGSDAAAAYGNDLDLFVRTVLVPLSPTCASDGDHDGYGSPGSAACPLGSATDCDDVSPWVRPGGRQLGDGLNNDCLDPLWPSLPPDEVDNDGDGYSEWSGPDCDDTNGSAWQSWSATGDIVSLAKIAAGAVTISWSPLPPPSGSVTTYDVLRAKGPFFAEGGTCVAVGVLGDAIDDSSGNPPSGQFFCYEVRAPNACPNASGCTP